jgi:hypothetical protein
MVAGVCAAPACEYEPVVCAITMMIARPSIDIGIRATKADSTNAGTPEMPNRPRYDPSINVCTPVS